MTLLKNTAEKEIINLIFVKKANFYYFSFIRRRAGFPSPFSATALRGSGEPGLEIPPIEIGSNPHASFKKPGEIKFIPETGGSPILRQFDRQFRKSTTLPDPIKIPRSRAIVQLSGAINSQRPA